MTQASYGGVNAGVPPAAAGGFKDENCKGPPGLAVTELPPPLNEWGQIECTPYGPVITAHEGWIWTSPGGYYPVWIPAQMVRSRPVLSGNTIYFTKIDFRKIPSDEWQKPLAVFQSIFKNDPPPKNGYRLDAVSVSGRSLLLYFFETGNYRWGVWCTSGKCDPSSWFMLLDMKHRPDEKTDQ